MNAKISTLNRYADSLGYIVQYHLIPTAKAETTQPIVVHTPDAGLCG